MKFYSFILVTPSVHSMIPFHSLYSYVYACHIDFRATWRFYSSNITLFRYSNKLSLNQTTTSQNRCGDTTFMYLYMYMGWSKVLQ